MTSSMHTLQEAPASVPVRSFTEVKIQSDVSSQADLPEVRAGVRLLARLARVAEKTCLESGISLPQYRLLVSASGTPQRASDLAEAIGVSRPTLTSLVDGLEAVGLIRRVPEPSDGRGVRLTLTDAGQEAAERAERALTGRLISLAGREVGDALGLISNVVDQLGEALDREVSGRQ